MATASHFEMHREHLRWHVEDDMWRDDLVAWEAEVDQAINELPRLETALRQHADALRKHAAAIRLYEQDFRADEHALAEFERGEPAAASIELTQVFDRTAEKHAAQLRNHEKIKRQHHDLIARWRLLTAPLVPPEPS
jgi:hypothetical protein